MVWPAVSTADALKAKARQLIQEGRLDEALKLCQNLIEQQPDDAEAWFLAGSLYGQLGKYAESEQCLIRVLNIKPDYSTVHYNLGVLYQNTDRYAEAERYLASFLRLCPENKSGLYTMALAQIAQQKFSAAVKNLQQIISLWPRDTDALSKLGQLFYELGRFDESAKFLDTALCIAPRNAQIAYYLGCAQEKLGKTSTALRSFLHALKCDLKLLDAHISAAEIYYKLGEYHKAVCLYRSARAGQTSDENVLIHFGDALIRTGGYDEARGIFQLALKHNANCYRAVKGLVDIYERKGNYKKAFSVLKPFIVADNVDPEIALAFATICPGIDRCDEAIAMMENVLKRQKKSLGKSHEMYLYFALGKLYDRKQAYDRAFLYYQRANSLKDATFDMEGYAAYLGQIRQTYGHSFIESAPHACSEEAGRLIFIIGMPRSGTTLVEQILGAHPQVEAGGELRYMNEVVGSLSQATDSRQPYPLCMDGLDQAGADRLAGYYIDQIRHLLHDNQYVTDKLPHNFMNLGLITLLFPEARIIHCRRNAMDTCLSCFFQDFDKGHYYAYDLATLAAYYHEYQQLMSHWEKVVGIEMLDISYEELVRDQEKYSRVLLDFCGLPWDECCLRFHENKRHIATASYDQVRQPIYGSSVARWKHYDPYIDSLKKALGSEAG